MDWVSVFIIYSSIETFASIELNFGFGRMNSRSKQPSIELTRYHKYHGFHSEVGRSWPMQEKRLVLLYA